MKMAGRRLHLGLVLGPSPKISLETGRSLPNAQSLSYFIEDREVGQHLSHAAKSSQMAEVVSGYCKNIKTKMSGVS